MATMNQAIRQMLSRRTQLAALMVVVALAAAAFISLSERASAQTADDVTMELLVYFPEDSDGVVASKGSQPATGLERVPVTFELRVTVANAASKNVRWRTPVYRPDVGVQLRDFHTRGRYGSPTTLPPGLFPYDRGPTHQNVFDSAANSWFDTNGLANGLADRFNRINVSGLRFWDVGTPTVYLDGRNGSTGTGTSPDQVVWDCRPADNDADTTRAVEIDRPNRPAVPATAGHVSCYLTVNGADPQVDIVAAADGTYTVSGQIRFFFPGGPGSTLTNADSVDNSLNALPSSQQGKYIGTVIGVTWDGYDVDVTGLLRNVPPIGSTDPNMEHIVVPQEVRDGSISGSATLTVKSIKEVASAALDFATHTAASSACPAPSGVTRSAGDTCPSTISGVRGDRQTGFLLKVLNEDGAASNWNGIRRIQLDVRGISADIKASSFSGGADGVTRECIGVAICSWNINATSGSQPWGGVSADKIGSLILKPAGTATGTAEVTATVYSATGERFTTETREVTITGRAEKFEITAPTSTLYRTHTADDDRDKLVLATKATDGGGNPVGGDALRSGAKITGPGNKNETSKFETLSRNAKGQIEVQLKSTTTGTAALAVGTYKLEASIGTGTGLKDTVEFTVVDKAAAEDGISVEFDPAVPTTVGEEVTATVTVQDAAGNAVADGTTVTVSASDSAGTGAALRLVGNSNPKTKNGTASVRMVTIGDGLAIVTVTADGSVEVATVRSNAMSASQVRGVEGLSRSDVNQFASWEPGNTVQASELFGELRSRGAGAIYRWDQATRAWLRYATDTSGRELPGSVNFQIARGDTLYIAG